MKRRSGLPRRTRVNSWLCFLVVGLVLATPALTVASPVPAETHDRDDTLAPSSLGFWLKVASLGIDLVASIITALEEIEKVQQNNPPQAPPRADGPPWQPTENPAPEVVHVDW